MTDKEKNKFRQNLIISAMNAYIREYPGEDAMVIAEMSIEMADAVIEVENGE